MKSADLNDYFDVLPFNGETLAVRDNKVSKGGVEIDFDEVKPTGSISLSVFNHEGYWMFAGVDSSGDRFVISCGEHK